MELNINYINYNIKKILEELRARIVKMPDIDEIIGDRQVIYQYNKEDFCVIKIKKDNLEIDFNSNKTIEDPIDFSWKIRITKKQKFNRRMQLKNISDIDIAFGLISQAINYLY